MSISLQFYTNLLEYKYDNYYSSNEVKRSAINIRVSPSQYFTSVIEQTLILIRKRKWKALHCILQCTSEIEYLQVSFVPFTCHCTISKLYYCYIKNHFGLIFAGRRREKTPKVLGITRLHSLCKD